MLAAYKKVNLILAAGNFQILFQITVLALNSRRKKNCLDYTNFCKFNLPKFNFNITLDLFLKGVEIRIVLDKIL